MKRVRNPKKTVNGVETRKRWNNEELKVLAQWIADNKHNPEEKGVTKNKETTISYIRRMFMETSLYEDGMTDDCMKCQYKKIVSSYKQTRDWINNTVQGEEDSQTFKDAVLSRCPYFYILDRDLTIQEFDSSGNEEYGRNHGLEECIDQKDETLHFQIQFPDGIDFNSIKDPLEENAHGNNSISRKESEKNKNKSSTSLSKSESIKALSYYEVVKEMAAEKMMHDQAMAKIREDSAIEMKKLELKEKAMELAAMKEIKILELESQKSAMKEIKVLELESQERMLKLTEESKRESDKKFEMLLEKIIDAKK